MIKGLNDLLRYFQTERHYKTDKKDKALEAIDKAIQETTKYSRKIEAGEPEDMDEEMELSNLWSKAAIHARYFSKELAGKLYIKSGYWSDPDTWNYAQIKGTGITLKHIQEEVKKLLKKKP
jgi:hypothetical protein